MTPDRIDPALVEKVAKAIYESGAYNRDPGSWGQNVPGHLEFDRNQYRLMAEAAIRAADEKRGLKEEFQSAWAFGAAECSTAEEARECSDNDGGRQAQVRLASDWRPVEQGDAE